MSDTNSLDALIQALRRLPGVGMKSAQRIAFHLLQREQLCAGDSYTPAHRVHRSAE